jgi:hypothetical protein
MMMRKEVDVILSISSHRNAKLSVQGLLPLLCFFATLKLNPSCSQSNAGKILILICDYEHTCQSVTVRYAME